MCGLVREDEAEIELVAEEEPLGLGERGRLELATGYEELRRQHDALRVVDTGCLLAALLLLLLLLTSIRGSCGCSTPRREHVKAEEGQNEATDCHRLSHANIVALIVLWRRRRMRRRKRSWIDDGIVRRRLVGRALRGIAVATVGWRFRCVDDDDATVETRVADGQHAGRVRLVVHVASNEAIECRAHLSILELKFNRREKSQCSRLVSSRITKNLLM